MKQYVEKIGIGFGAFKVAVKDGDKTLWGMIDKNGYEIVPCEYDEVRPGVNFDQDGNLIESFNLVKKDGLWGILHEDYDVNFIFEEIKEFDLVGADFAQYPHAQYKGFWGVGFPNNPIVPFVYDYIACFVCDGFDVYRDPTWSVALYNGKWGVLGVEREICSVLVPFIYDSAIILDYDYYDNILLKKDGLWGIIDHKGDEIVPFIFDDVVAAEGDCHLKVKYEGEWITIDAWGNEVEASDEEPEDDDGNLREKRDGEWSNIDACGNEVEASDEEPEDDDKEEYFSVDQLPF